MTMRNTTSNRTACSVQSKCFLSFACNLVEGNSSHSFITQENLEKGSIVWLNQDEDINFFYIVHSGVIACISCTLDGDYTSHAIFGKGHTVNEMCLFTKFKIPFGMKALTDVVLCKVRAFEVEQFIFKDNSLLPTIFTSIVESIYAVNAYTDILFTKKVYDRVKEFALLMSDCLERDDKHPKITLTHQELADMIKADRVTVTNVLRQLEFEGFLKRGSKGFFLELDETIRYSN